MKFLVYPKGLLQNHSENLVAYLKGADGTVTGVQLELEEEICSFPAETMGFASFSLSCPVEGFGRPLVTSSSLEDREEPYNLAVELARGKISCLRNHIQEWITEENKIPEEFHQLHQESYQLFTQAIFQQHQPELASEIAWKSLEKAFEASEYLCQFYVNGQLITDKDAQNEYKHFGTILKDQDSLKDKSPVIKDHFSRVCLPVNWNQIEETQGEADWNQLDLYVESCLNNSIRCYSNALLDFCEGEFPAWLGHWQHDFESFVSIVCDYVESVVCRYSDNIKVWNIARSFLWNDFKDLSQKELLTAVAHALNTARQIEKNLLLGVSVVHPWGILENKAGQELSPLHAIDLLQRTGVGLSWVSLEIPMGYSGKNFVPYDLMELSRLIDEWSVIELPLDIVLAFPSSSQTSINSVGPSIDYGIWKKENSEETQQEWMEYYLPTLIQKSNVMSITWTDLSDHPGMSFPQSGLINSDGMEKKSLSTFGRFRKQYGPPR